MRKASKDPEYQVKQAQVEHLYAIAGGEFGPLASCPAAPPGHLFSPHL